MRLLRRILTTAWLLALGTGTVAFGQGAVAGKLLVDASPLPAARVYAYQLASSALDRAVTDGSGAFRFEGLPAGLYKIVAFKPGFVPAVALLTRASAQAAQHVEMRLQPAPPADSGDAFWAARRRIPPDVLREIEMATAAASWSAEEQTVPPWRGEMEALAGVDRTLDDQAAQMTGGRVDIEAAIRDVRVDLAGDYLAVEAATGAAAGLDGRAQSLSLDIEDGGVNRVELTSHDNRLREAADPVAFESHRLAWSRLGEAGTARVTAQYTQESNYFGRNDLGTLWLPEASRSWRLEGSYSKGLGASSRLEAGVRYRERQIDSADDRFGLPAQRVEVFGRAGTRLNPTVLLEYGMYSALSDGSVALAPRGSLVLQLSPSWQARTSASIKVHEGDAFSSFLRDFGLVHHGDLSACEGGAERCYQVHFSNLRGGQERFSVGAVHREFDETLRLLFDRNFFNQEESLFLVPGDTVPELRLAFTRRLAPQIETRLESSLGSGGGGIVWAGPQPRPYTNDVAYLVTSLDTRFQSTRTGVFLAVHHLAQRLEPLAQHRPERLVEMQRLQLLLTQELDFLHQLASDFAVQLDMELSRGLQPFSTHVADWDDPDALRSRVTGGFAVSF